MNYRSGFQVRIINFWKRNKNKILIFLIIWLIIIIINNIIKNKKMQIGEPSTTYTPHVTVMDKEKEVPEKYQEKIVNLVDEYFNYCNNSEYEKAYNLITEECRKANYPTLESFTAYVNKVFEGKKKIYNIQSYSIVDNKYIYNIRILDDILANGTTDGYYYYEEKIVLTEENGQMKLSIAEFINEEEPNIIVEDDYMIVKVLNKVTEYENEIYTIQVINKTDNYIVIADGTQNNEIKLDLNAQQRSPDKAATQFVISPNSFNTQEISFRKYYDEGMQASAIRFGSIRIFKDYNYSSRTTEENMNNAVKLYSLDIGL